MCGRDLSRKRNLDFSKKIICDFCLQGYGASEDEQPQNEKVDVGVVRKLFESIENREIINVNAISILEEITHHQFKDTKDSQEKMKKFLLQHDYRGNDLRKARKQGGLDQSELADLFRVSKHSVKQMETNKKPLSEDARGFIKSQGIVKTVPLKKWKKTGNMKDCIHPPENSKTSPERIRQKEHVTAPCECPSCGNSMIDRGTMKKSTIPGQLDLDLVDCSSKGKSREPRYKKTA